MESLSKKILSIVVAGSMVFGITACGAKINASENSADVSTETGEIIYEETDVTDDVMGTDMLDGGWSASENTEISEEVRKVFDKALDGMTGVDYEPVAYLGSQVVAGTNHCILCRATVVYPDAEPYYTLMYIYEDLEGNTEIIGFSDVEIGNYE